MPQKHYFIKQTLSFINLYVHVWRGSGFVLLLQPDVVQTGGKVAEGRGLHYIQTLCVGMLCTGKYLGHRLVVVSRSYH